MRWEDFFDDEDTGTDIHLEWPIIAAWAAFGVCLVFMVPVVIAWLWGILHWVVPGASAG